jgi:hypothetical protein
MPSERVGRNTNWTAVVMTAALLITSSALIPAQGPEKSGGVKVITSLYSIMGVQNDQAGWVGNAIISVAGQAPVQATYFCPAAIPQFKHGGELYGTETCTYTLPDGTYTVTNRFTALPDSAPNLYIMHTLSTITNGTGRYEKASGQFIERAQFIFDPNFPVPLPALGRSEGVIFGIQ